MLKDKIRSVNLNKKALRLFAFLIGEAKANPERLEHEINHALNILRWLFELRAKPSHIMQASAILHDSQRLIKPFSVAYVITNRKKYKQYKTKHSNLSADIASRLCRKAGFTTDECVKVKRIVADHEDGTFKESHLLMTADSLSFFDKNLPYFCKNYRRAEVEDKIRYMFSRLDKKGRELVKRNIKNFDISKKVARFIDRLKI